MTDDHASPPGGLREYALLLRRRKFLILAAVVLATGLTLGFSLQQGKLYQASVQVFLNNSNPAQLLTGAGSGTEATANPARVVANQASIATSPKVLSAAVRELRLSGSAAISFRRSSAVVGDADRDILVFTSEAGTAGAAARNVNGFAAAYVAYQQTLAVSTLRQAVAGTTAELTKLHGGGTTAADRSLYDQLLAKQQQLTTLETLQTAQAVVLGPSTSASLIQPKTLRNVFLGAILGVLLGVAGAFVRDAFDARIRSGDQIAAVLDLPLLGRIPPPPRGFRSHARLVMQDAPFGLPAEAFRMLRTNLDFATVADAGLDGSGRTVVVTSTVAGEGKTTTISNLALTYARAGLRVALVDLDLRRPSVSRFFPADGDQALGITDVALGHASLDDVLSAVPIRGFGDHNPARNRNTASDGTISSGGPTDQAVTAVSEEQGSLVVLSGGTIPPNIGEFVGGRAIAGVLQELQTRADLVLIDTPPLLTFSDAATITRRANGVLMIARLNLVTRTNLREARRLLAGTEDRRWLGVIITGADEDDQSGTYLRYGYGYADRE